MPSNSTTTVPGLFRPADVGPTVGRVCPSASVATPPSQINPLGRGADVHVGTDGNFSHRHLASAGNGPSYHDPSYILPKTLVDEVGNRIERARQAPTRQYHPSVPDEAVDECEKSYDAAKGNHQADSARFDATGWMSLVCRHDIPLFFVNIDTPGEQQKYSVALLEHLFSLLPPQATVAALYDVGCVLDRSLRMVSLSLFISVDSINDINISVRYSPGVGC